MVEHEALSLILAIIIKTKTKTIQQTKTGEEKQNKKQVREDTEFVLQS
jgi:hypothetical protein